MKSALVLFAHGARDSQWSEPFRALRNAVSARRPDLAVELAFLELMEPALGDCVERAGPGWTPPHHDRAAVPRAGRPPEERSAAPAEGPWRADTRTAVIDMLPPIGEVAELLNAIAEWLVSGAAALNADDSGFAHWPCCRNSARPGVMASWRFNMIVFPGGLSGTRWPLRRWRFAPQRRPSSCPRLPCRSTGTS